MNIYKEHAKAYLDKQLSVIPDRWASKKAMIKDYSRFCYELPKTSDYGLWFQEYSNTNLALCLGEASGIIALDFDCEDQKIIDELLPMLPESPVEKIGAKGFTRFFKYSGEHTQLVKFNGEVVLEILSNNKKTTLPPSRHPNGSDYKWLDKTLLDIDKDSLPSLPPFLIANVESKLRTAFSDLETTKNGMFNSGRNNNLSQLCGKLIQERLPVDQCIKQLVEYDKKEHENPLFTDPEEMRHTEPFTNALLFYTNHLATVNTRHFRRSEEYEIPVTASAINAQEPVKKAKKLKTPRVCSCPLCGKDFTIKE